LFGAELYWPEKGADRICRSLPDGSSWSVFISGVDTVQAVERTYSPITTI